MTFTRKNVKGSCQPQKRKLEGSRQGPGKPSPNQSSNRKIKVAVRKVQPTQEMGFARCLDFLLRKWRINVPEKVLLKHINRCFLGTEDKLKAKIFKLSLAVYFSQQMNQDLPEDHDQSIELFPNSVNYFVKKVLIKSNIRKLKFCFDLLQCKSLANEVPREMIIDAYQKHAKILSNPITRPTEEILKEFENFILPYINLLPNLESTRVAPVKAYLGYSRKNGGVNKALQPNLKRFDFRDCSPRIDPTTLHIEGKPGIGKSLLYAKMGKKFDRYFGEENSIFWKSSTSDHFDGYAQQPVLGIDDIFYQNWSEKCDHSKTEELLQLISTVDYRPPMADLRNKGIQFNSPFVLLSSNNGNTYLRMIKQVVNNREAFFRRLGTNIKLIKNEKSFTVQHLGLFRNSIDLNTEVVKTVDFPSLNEVCEYLFNILIQEYERKVKFYMDEFYGDNDEFLYQHINGSDYYYSFPRKPIPETRIVEAYAIPEPLKVRMITKGHPHTYCLKPVQLAMFETLKNFPIFEPCWEPDYKKVFSPKDNEVLVSGDYSSATDGICQDLTRIVGKHLAKRYPELSEYIINGTGSHIVKYPKGAKQHDIQQTGGQLMGSLLSFPILCLVNAFTLAKVRNQTLSELNCLIHGDDLSFSGSMAEIQEWKALASQLGLEPSIGKNYLSDRWYTIDSKLFVDGKHLPNLKWKQLREPGPEEISSIISVLGIPQTVRFCKDTLNKTNRSLDVGLLYGGLNPKDLVPKERLQKIFSIGRSLDRLPRVTKGLMTVRDLDVDELIPIPLEVNPFFRKDQNSAEKWYQENKWLKNYNRYDYLFEHQLDFIKLQPYRLGMRNLVDFNSFDKNVVECKVFKELTIDTTTNTAILETHNYIDFPSEKKKRMCFSSFPERQSSSSENENIDE